MAEKVLGVVGTLTRDTIHLPTGATVRSLGGIAYTLFPLGSLLPPEWTIHPVCHVGEDVLDWAKEVLEACPRIEQGGLISVEERNNTVELFYQEDEERVEVLSGGVPPLALKELESLAECDYVLVNLISGFELDLPTFEALRRLTDAPIYADLHTLLRGVEPDGRRTSQRLQEPDRWLAVPQTVQVNRQEAALVLGEHEPLEEKRFSELARRAHQAGVETLLITLGQKGAYVSWRQGGEVQAELIPALPIEEALDPTGCGDVFGAAYVATCLRGLSPPQAVRGANRAAAVNARHPGLAGVGHLSASLLTG